MGGVLPALYPPYPPPYTSPPPTSSPFAVQLLRVRGHPPAAHPRVAEHGVHLMATPLRRRSAQKNNPQRSVPNTNVLQTAAQRASQVRRTTLKPATYGASVGFRPASWLWTVHRSFKTCQKPNRFLKPGLGLTSPDSRGFFLGNHPGFST